MSVQAPGLDRRESGPGVGRVSLPARGESACRRVGSQPAGAGEPAALHANASSELAVRSIAGSVVV